jgi:short-subunit dehydrogenase
MSEALASENASKGVNVTAVCPGFTWSEFHDVTGTRDKMNKMPRLLWLKSDAVAKEGYDAVMNGRSVVVNGALYRLFVWLTGAMPHSVSGWVSVIAGSRYRRT